MWAILLAILFIWSPRLPITRTLLTQTFDFWISLPVSRVGVRVGLPLTLVDYWEKDVLYICLNVCWLISALVQLAAPRTRRLFAATTNVYNPWIDFCCCLGLHVNTYIYLVYLIMLSLAGARGYMHVLEFGWAAGVCNRMLTLAPSVSAPIDSCFGHLNF